MGGQEEHPAAGTLAAADQANRRAGQKGGGALGELGQQDGEARDTPIADEKGESRISVGDYAAAVIDTLENESFIHARFTVAY